ncbi:hypothetical protein cypCar_00020306, partial [Cyprinus carpio]
MTNTSQTFSDVRNVILSAHKNTGAQDKVSFYDTWAENYEQNCNLGCIQPDKNGAKLVKL